METNSKKWTYSRLQKNVWGRLLSALSKPKLIKNNFYNERLKKIGEDLNKSRYKFSKSEIKEIRKNIYEIESQKKYFNTKNKRDWKKPFYA